MSTNESMASQVTDVPNEEELPFEEEITPQQEEQAADEALENIEANDAADPTPLIINPESIPEGMTAEEITTAWGQTGNIILGSTGSSTTGVIYHQGTGATFGGTDPITPPEVTEDPQPETIPETETPERVQQRIERQRSRLEAEKERYIEEQKLRQRGERIAEAQRKKKRLNGFGAYVITQDDLIIVQQYRNGVHFIKADVEVKGTVRNLFDKRLQHKVKGGRVCPLTDGFVYDKNMNPLTVNYSGYSTKSDKRFTRIDKSIAKSGGNTHPEYNERFLVVDKVALMKSKGEDFIIKYRVGYSAIEALEVKKKIVKRIAKAEKFITYLRGLINKVYDEDNFEILYKMRFNGDSTSEFKLLFQFPDLTISNSIELTHSLDNLVTRMQGVHFSTHGNKMSIVNYLDGQRTKFSPVDAFYGYNHSHLPSYASNMDSFCMGSDHFMAKINVGYIEEIEFEMLLHGMMDHVAWESLEGGPYTTMESIGRSTGSIVTENNTHIMRSYGRHTAIRLFNLIKKLDLNEVRDAFVLTTLRNKEVTYTFNRRVFIIKLLPQIDLEDLVEIANEFEIQTYSYLVAEDKFRSNENDHESIANWSNFKKGALKRAHALPVLYINGKHVRPQVTKFDKSLTKSVKETMLSPHPDILMYIARVIHYHLLNELKNAKNKR